MAEGWINRLSDERNELGERIRKLDRFLNSGESHPMSGDFDADAEQCRLMFFQLDIMQAYHKILTKRLEACGSIPCFPAPEPAPAL